MLRQYATEEEIAEALSGFKTGDTVTLLKDRTIGSETISSGTLMRISRIKPKIDYEILTDDLELYKKKNENFLYFALVPEHNAEFLLFPNEFGKGKLTDDEIKKILSKQNKEQISDIVITILIALFLFVASELMFTAIIFSARITTDLITVLTASAIPSFMLMFVFLLYIATKLDENKYIFTKKPDYIRRKKK